MKGFFSRIKGKMSQEFGGRYLGEVLAEVFREEPSMTEVLWGRKLKDFTIVTDNDYHDSFKRLADLAVINRNTGDTIAIAEIKYDDEKGSFTEKQLKVYLEYASKNKIPFIYLTKNFLPSKQLLLLKEYKLARCHLLYSELGENLEKWLQKNPTNCYGLLLADFLRDEGIMWNKKFSKKAIKALIIKTGRFPHKSGHGRLVSESRMTEDIPAAFTAIMGNIAILGRVLQDEIDPERAIVSISPSTDFSFNPHYSIKKLKKLLADSCLEEDGDELVIYRGHEIVLGGDFIIWSRFVLPVKPYLCFTSSIRFSLKKGGGNLEIFVGASVSGSVNDWESDCAFPIRVDENDEFELDEIKIRKAALKQLEKAITDCTKDQKNQLEKDAKAYLNQIAKNCAN